MPSLLSEMMLDSESWDDVFKIGETLRLFESRPKTKPLNKRELRISPDFVKVIRQEIHDSGMPVPGSLDEDRFYVDLVMSFAFPTLPNAFKAFPDKIIAFAIVTKTLVDAERSLRTLSN